MLNLFKMKSLKIIILLLFALIILGCTSTTNDRKEIESFTGFEGLTVEFGKNAPPLKVFEQSSFPVLLKIRNNGANNIANNNGVLTIGRERDYVSRIRFERNSRLVIDPNSDNKVNFSLDGKTLINTKGDELIVYFDTDTGRLEPQSEQKNSVITANLCYPYHTNLSTTICIDPDVVGLKPGQKVCQVKDLTFSSGQGAPIAITRIEEQIIPVIDQDIVKPQFLIFIENKGSGNPIDIKSYENVCGKADLANQPADQKNNIWNVAYVRAFASGNEQLVCCPNKEGQCRDDSTNPNDWVAFVRFRDNKDFVRCTFRNGISKDDAAFTSPIKIEVEYGYAQTVSAVFTIQKPLRY